MWLTTSPKIKVVNVSLLLCFWLCYRGAVNLTLIAQKFVILAAKDIAPACLSYLPFLCYFVSEGKKYKFFGLEQMKLQEKFHSTQNAKSIILHLTHVNVNLAEDGIKNHAAGTVRLTNDLFLHFNLFSTRILISCKTLLAGYGESSGTE